MDKKQLLNDLADVLEKHGVVMDIYKGREGSSIELFSIEYNEMLVLMRINEPVHGAVMSPEDFRTLGEKKYGE